MQSSERPTGPVFVLTYNHIDKIIETLTPTSTQNTWDIHHLKSHCLRVIHKATKHTTTHPDRIYYAFASKVFTVSSPRPLGGKRRPGFLEFNGDDTRAIVDFIFDFALQPPPRKGKKGWLPAGLLLKYVVDCFNEVVGYHHNGMKDLMDDAVLRGMRRSGHLAKDGRTLLPLHLRDNNNNHTTSGSGDKLDSKHASTTPTPPSMSSSNSDIPFDHIYYPTPCPSYTSLCQIPPIYAYPVKPVYNTPNPYNTTIPNPYTITTNEHYYHTTPLHHPHPHPYPPHLQQHLYNPSTPLFTKHNSPTISLTTSRSSEPPNISPQGLQHPFHHDFHQTPPPSSSQTMISPHLSSQTIITPKTITKSHTIHNSVASTQPINTSPSTTAHPIKTPPSTHTIKTSPSTTSHPIKTSPATSQPHPLQRPHPPKRKRDSPKNTPSISFLLNSPPQKHQKLTPSKPQTSFQNLPSSMLPLSPYPFTPLKSSESVTW